MSRINTPLLALIVSALFNPSVYAQGGGYALEEVVVTAQKKAESLQDTPISLTAFGEERLETDGISNLGDIGSKVPSLTIEPFPINNATLRIFIRGIGITDAQVTQDPPVGIYVDGAYVARSTGTALDVAELQRIEILRGPQGTLYGRNTTGGAINMITKKPNVDEIEFKQKFTVSNRNAFTSKTSLNVPLSETFAAKLSYLYTVSDGFQDNDGPGGDWGDREVQGARLDLRWDISDSLVMDYAYDLSKLDYYNYTYQPNRPNDPNKPRGSAVDLIDEKAVASTRANGGYNTKVVDTLNTVAPMEESQVEIGGHSLTFTYDINETMQFKYIAAARTLDDASYADLAGGAATGTFPGSTYRLDSNEYVAPDGTYYPLVIPQVKQDQFSHEFQLTGDAFEGAVNYIAGLYYFKEEAEEDNSPAHHQFSSLIDDDTFPGGRLANITSNFYEVENEALAMFMQATWVLPIWDERFAITLGARHSEDNRKAFKNIEDRVYIYNQSGTRSEATNDPSSCGTDPTCLAIAPVIQGLGIPNPQKVYTSQREADFADDSFAITFEYDINDDINTYFKVIEAYKSGGFNTRDPHQNAASDGNDFGFGFEEGFNEEKVLSYEWGVKSELLDRTLRINADVFYSEYTDIQLNFLVQGTVADTKVTNAGKGEMFGFEADVTWMAQENLMIILNYAYLEARITEATNPTDGSDVTNQFTFGSAPQNSGTMAADYTFYYGDWGRGSVNISYNYMDNRDGGVRRFDRNDLQLRDYYLWNGRISLSDMPAGDGMLTFGLWGKNLLDREYEITTVNNLPHADRASIYGEPRSYGIDVIYNY